MFLLAIPMTALFAAAAAIAVLHDRAAARRVAIHSDSGSRESVNA
jgi:sec-independent protein translocase protein TatC